ncbi:MAG: MFS transporter [Allosphingosinicella sp.]
MARPPPSRTTGTGAAAAGAVAAAWAITSVYYFYQYLMRSAPGVMLPELTAGFGLGSAALASLLGLFYYAYAPFSLVAGVAMDRLGPKWIVPLGAATVAAGALLFATGDPALGGIGRFMQGAGGVFGLIGAVYLATNYLPPSRAATLIGVTQMVGMAGGAAGQFVVGPLIARGLGWDSFWMAAGLCGFPIALALFFLMPSPPRVEPEVRKGHGLAAAARTIGTVFLNPQSILCGLVAGLMFLPTTIFDMVWGVRYLQEAHDVPYSMAVLRSASVPFGWIIGCPLLGWASDRIGRRKPVIVGAALVLLAAMATMLFGSPALFPPFLLALVAGIASGAAMLPYTVAKEVNRAEHAGTATGVVNFVNFVLTALLGPVFAGLLIRASAGGERELVHYQQAFAPLILCVGAGAVAALFLRETGPAAAARAPAPRLKPAES